MVWETQQVKLDPFSVGIYSPKTTQGVGLRPSRLFSISIFSGLLSKVFNINYVILGGKKVTKDKKIGSKRKRYNTTL
jgi:hypothetical protein